MALKKPRSKKRNSIISVEGSRELEPQIDPQKTSRRFVSSVRNPKSLVFISLIIIVVLLILSLPAMYFYNQYKAAQLAKNPTAAAEAQVKDLTSEVGRILLLPTGESPTIATVSDKSKLAGQKFFDNAENGDKVLIYSAAKKAILYRPSAKKIIEVGPISINASAGKPNAQVAGASTSATVTPAVAKIALLNGTTVAGLTKKIETALAGKVANAQVVVKDNAAKNDYTQTLVIAPSSALSTTAQQIATLLGGKVTTLPAGEVAPATTDITVILGQNSAQ